jgi:hypothetical protein
MILATYGSTLYKLIFLGHMISMVVAFAPAVVNPLTAARAKADGPDARRRLGGYQAINGKLVHLPALVLLGAFGIGLVFEGGFGFDETWVSLAFLVWIALGGVVSGLILPAERRLAGGDLEAEAKVALGGQIATVLFLVMLYLMIWKPGA